MQPKVYLNWDSDEGYDKNPLEFVHYVNNGRYPKAVARQVFVVVLHIVDLLGIGAEILLIEDRLTFFG